MEYLKEHLKFLIDEFINAYENERFEDAIRLRRQIANIKDMLNHYEIKNI
jgi:excinuclease UvrABC nuclease subunit